MNPGIYKDLSIEDYHKDKFLVSSTGLKQAVRSTRDFAFYLLEEQQQKTYFDFGNAFELAIMDEVNETELFLKEVAIKPTRAFEDIALKEKPELKVVKNSAKYKELSKEFDAQNFGKYLINDVGPESSNHLENMVASCLENDTVKRLLTGTEYQVSLVWEDKQTGLKCKTRPDVCRTKKNVLVDIKTTIDASPQGFARQAAKLDYPLQAVMQCIGAVETGLIDNVAAYYWLAVEKGEPFNFALYEFQQDDLEYFTDAFHFYLKRCATAIDAILKMDTPSFTKVPSYGENADNKFGVLQLEIPLWYRK